MEGKEDYFAVPDLEEFQGKKGYKNSNAFWQKFYKTTIVAPIRIESQLINNQQQGASKKIDTYNILGFLCVDSKKVAAFKKPFGPLGVEFVKGIADALYIYLERSKSHYLRCIKQS